MLVSRLTVALVTLASGRRRAVATSSECAATRELTPDERSQYHADGFVIVKNMFSEDEVSILRSAIETDPLISGHVMPMGDGEGRVSKLTLWNKAGNDTFGMFARGRRWARAAEALLAAPPYHFHTKVMLKEPRVGGTWEWHQDFGYWYQVGALEPDKMLSAVLAVDDHTRANGCMQLLRGSHRLGRLAHGLAGEQAGADAAMVRAARSRFELVHAEMRAGDILFTHSNLLHASAPNDSPSWRRSLIVAYNAVDNPPREGTVCPLPADAPIAPLFEDSAIRDRGVVHIAGADAADFLDHDRNAAQFSAGAS